MSRNVLDLTRKDRSESFTSVFTNPDNSVNFQNYDSNNDNNTYLSDNVFLTDIWNFNDFFNEPPIDPVKSTWRSKERMKTTGVVLVLCLNIGTDPPGIVKPYPCARKECWLDPFVHSKQKSLEIIGNALQQQYEKWQLKAKYKQCLDPTPEDLKRVCINLRKSAKGDRLLMHYNGHGVPTPTKNGEFWVFVKNYTHYMPVTVTELKSWLGEPAIYVFDCSGAGILIPHFVEVAVEPTKKGQGSRPNDLSTETSMNADNNIIILAACRGNESLPLNPQYPADIFTACLTTPVVTAIRWLIIQVCQCIYIMLRY